MESQNSPVLDLRPFTAKGGILIVFIFSFLPLYQSQAVKNIIAHDLRHCWYLLQPRYIHYASLSTASCMSDRQKPTCDTLPVIWFELGMSVFCSFFVCYCGCCASVYFQGLDIWYFWYFLMIHLYVHLHFMPIYFYGIDRDYIYLIT